MRALITGAAGFIGSNLYNSCINHGWSVTGVDDLSNGHEEFLQKGGTFIKADFTNVDAAGYDVVFHLAALPRVSYSCLEPVHTHEVNVFKTVKLIDNVWRYGAKLVFASSSSVYGNTTSMPTRESIERNPGSPYALQKAHCEDYIKMISNIRSMNATCLRFFNVYGTNQLGSSPYATAISSWLTAIKNGRPMRRDGDGKQTRDMVHVDDVVRACMLAARNDVNTRSKCINIGSGTRVSNNTIIQLLHEHYPSAKVIDAPERIGDVKHTLADITLAKKLLDYEPRVSIIDGVNRTVEWFNTNWSWLSNLELSV